MMANVEYEGNIITIPDEDEVGRNGAIVCERDDGPGAIVHDIGPDCARWHGVRIVARRCSVCDLDWGDGAYSRHEGCAYLLTDGTRQYAHPVLEARKAVL